MRRKNLFVALFLIGCFLFSCNQSLYVPTSSDKAQQEKLLAGRTLYINHCGGCHNLYLPKQFNSNQWQKNLNDMQKRAKITDEEKQLILNYLVYQL